jgi:hypothetical protein
MSLEEPLTEEERKKLRRILDDPKAVDSVIDKALKGWRGRGAWKKKTLFEELDGMDLVIGLGNKSFSPRSYHTTFY